MRRIAMILIILLGGGAILYSVICADDGHRIYSPGLELPPVVQMFTADNPTVDDDPASDTFVPHEFPHVSTIDERRHFQ